MLHPEFAKELLSLLVEAHQKDEQPDPQTYAMLREVIVAAGLTIPEELP